MSLTDKQKAARAQALGSSDAPVVCGVSPYEGPLELYYKLHGELPRYTEDETWEQKVGSKVEPIIAELVAEELGVKIRRAAPAVHPRYPFMTCNLDFEIVSHPNGPGILEIKRRSCTPFSELPEDMTLQVVHQMAVKRRQWAKVAVQFQWGKPVVFDVERDKELEEYLIEIEARFMLRVQQGEPPDETWAPANIGILKKLYPSDTGQVITLSERAVSAAVGYLGARQNEEEAYALKTQYEGWLKGKIGDASIAKIPGFGEITWKSTKPGKDFDEARFKAEHPDLYAQYEITKQGHRRFMVKPSKEVSCKTLDHTSPTKLARPATDPPLPSPSLPET